MEPMRGPEERPVTLMKRIIFLIALLAWGCHGSELRFGTGRTFNDFSGSGSMSGGGGGSHGNSKNHSDNVGRSDFSFSQDDSTTVYAELAFQLTPQSVIVTNKVPPRLWPFPEPDVPVPLPEPPVATPEPEHDPFARCEEILRQGLAGVNERLGGLDGMAERLTKIEERLTKMEEETGDHISWTDIGVGGGSAGSGAGLLWLAWVYYQNRRKKGELDAESQPS